MCHVTLCHVPCMACGAIKCGGFGRIEQSNNRTHQPTHPPTLPHRPAQPTRLLLASPIRCFLLLLLMLLRGGSVRICVQCDISALFEERYRRQQCNRLTARYFRPMTFTAVARSLGHIDDRVIAPRSRLHTTGPGYLIDFSSTFVFQTYLVHCCSPSAASVL